jgi:TetR/AcrR family transcriptional repressor of nem operon
MKKSKAETVETRRRIMRSAAAEFRRKGIHETSIADVMQAAGLTHGAFYRHFASKDQLIAEACSSSGLATVGTPPTRSVPDDRASAEAILENYLSPAHRDDIAAGCTFAALGSELARACPETREAASTRILALIETLSKRLDDTSSDTAKGRAIVAVSAMVGALTMSRIMTDTAMSDAILAHTQKELCRLMQEG